MLLINALGALDKALMQSVVIRADDIEGLLSGKVALEEGDFRSTLIKLINEQLNSISPKEQKLLLGAIYKYFDKNPNLDTLLDPTKAFLTLFDPTFLNRARLSQPS
jgi:hypothetical protein